LIGRNRVNLIVGWCGRFLFFFVVPRQFLGWRQNNGNRSNQESEFDFLATGNGLVNSVNLIVGWCGRFLFLVVPRQFSQDTGEWRENQILIPDWTNFHCPGATLVGEWPEQSNLLGSSQSIFSFCPSLQDHQNFKSIGNR